MELRTRKNRDKGLSFFIDYTLDGQRRRKVLKNIGDRATAEIALADFKVRLAREEAGLPTRQNLSLGSCLKAYREAKEATLSEKAYKVLKARTQQIETHFGEGFPVRALTEKAANEFRRTLRKAKKPDSPWTINAKIAVLRAALARAVKAGWIAKNPLADLEGLSDPRAPKWRFLKSDEVEKLIEVLREERKVEVKRERDPHTRRTKPNERLYHLVVFLLNTGARLGEAQAVTWRDIDMDRGLVRLNTTKRATKGRSAKARYVPMNAALRELLSAMPEDEEPLFPYANNVNRDFDTVCTAAGIGHCRIHDLRHTAASALAMAGVPLNTIRELLGHATMTMTLRYAHLSPNVTAEAVEALNFGAQGAVAKVLSVAEAAG